MTTVAIISDTHSYLDERIKTIVAEADIAVHAGDIGSQEVLEQMTPISGKVVAVTGNNDLPFLWPASQNGELEKIPKVNSLDLPGGKLVLEHGDRHDRIKPPHAKLRESHSDAKVIVYGHTHKLIIDDNQEPWVVNPGAAGQVRTNGGPSCLLLHADESDWRIETIRFEDED